MPNLNFDSTVRYSAEKLSAYDDFRIPIFTGSFRMDGILEWIEEVDEFF